MKTVKENVFNEMVHGRWWNLTLFIDEIVLDNPKQSLINLEKMMKLKPNSPLVQSSSGKLNQNTKQRESPLYSECVTGEQSILVLGGYTKHSDQNLYPISFRVNEKGLLKDKPEECGNRRDFQKVDKALGHFLDGDLVICPQTEKGCTIIENNGIRKIGMNVRRSVKSLVKLNDSSLWITGGSTREMSTELITLNGSREGENLPFGIESHCMVKYDAKHILMIGGNYRVKGGKFVTATNKTWIIDTEQNFNITEGPQLNQGRMLHYCGKLKDMFGNVLVVVVSGKNSKSIRCVGTLNMIII